MLPTRRTRLVVQPTRDSRRFAFRRGILGVEILGAAALAVGLTACLCATDRLASIDIVSRTKIKGEVNGAKISGSIEATLNTGRGGHSTCEFTQLPPMFNPGTFSTHA